jgi:heat shock protein HtpX
MYSEITSNTRKSWALIVIFIILVMGLGWFLDYYYDGGGLIIAIAVIWSLGSTLVSWYAGDKISLASAGAKLILKSDAPDVYNVVENLCIANGQPVPKIYVINDPSPNAFATGRDPEHASLAFTTGILALLNRTELEGVAAHELSHVKNYDIRVMTLVVVLVGTVVLVSDLFLRSFMFRGRGRGDRRNDGGLGLIIGLVIIILSPIIANLIKLAVSRKREYLADASGALLTRYPEGLASALEKIAAANIPLAHASNATAHLYINNPFGQGGAVSNLFSTHPPINDRIRVLREMIARP